MYSGLFYLAFYQGRQNETKTREPTGAKRYQLPLASKAAENLKASKARFWAIVVAILGHSHRGCMVVGKFAKLGLSKLGPPKFGFSANLQYTLSVSRRWKLRKTTFIGKFGLTEIFLVGELGLAPPQNFPYLHPCCHPLAGDAFLILI